jgi:hypothetical protein
VKADLGELNAFVTVARAKGLRQGAGGSAPGLSGAVNRLEAQFGVRLLHRTTRSVMPTEAGEPPAGAAWPGTDRGGRVLSRILSHDGARMCSQ